MAVEIRKILDEFIPDVAKVKETIDVLIVGKIALVRDDCSRGVLVAAPGKGELFIEIARAGDRVYIPTSSIKGVLRRVSEAIAKNIALLLQEPERSVLLAHCELEHEGVTHLCYDVTYLLKLVRSRDSLALLAERGYIPRDTVDEILNQLSSSDSLAVAMGIRRIEPLFSQLCPVCRVFGGPGLAGKLRVASVTLSNADLSVSVDRLTHTSIDRGRRVVLEGALFVKEYADIKDITVEITARNVVKDSTDYKLLIATLKALKDMSLLIGHSKSRGLGWYRLDTARTRLVYVDLTRIQSLTQLLNVILNPYSFGEELKI